VGLQAWRVAAILLVCLVGLHIVGKAAELSVLKRAEHKLDVSIRETVQTVMPGQAASADTRKLLETRLAAARASTTNGLLPALEALVQAKNAAPGATVEALSFQHGSLELKVAATDASSLDRIGQALRSNGWQADLTSGNNVASGYEGHLQVHQ
jgi:type II secretory pathway component PulL